MNTLVALSVAIRPRIIRLAEVLSARIVRLAEVLSARVASLVSATSRRTRPVEARLAGANISPPIRIKLSFIPQQRWIVE